MSKIGIAICFLLLTIPFWGWDKPHPDPKQPVPPQPVMTISLEKGSLEMGESVMLVLGITNNSAYPLRDLRLMMDAPDFIHLGHGGDTIRLDDIPAWGAARRGRLVLKILPKGEVGDFNLLFTVSYRWKSADTEYQGMVTQEKAVKIGLFGTDKVVGVPLALAEFVVPGIFFLFVLRLFGVSRDRELGAEDKIIVSVIVSVVCLSVFELLGHDGRYEWASSFNLDGSISIPKFLWLGLSGAVIGLVVSGGVKWFRYIRQQRLKKMAFTGEEKDAGVVYKALKINSKYQGNVWQFTCKDGNKYRAAHFFQLDQDYVLIGAFKIDLETLEAGKKEKLRAHLNGKPMVETRKNLLAVIEIVGGITSDDLKLRNTVKKITGGVESNAGRYVEIPKETVQSMTTIQLMYMKLIDLV